MRALVLALPILACVPSAASACRLASVLNGDVTINPMAERGSALVRAAHWTQNEQLGALRGMLVRSREGVIIQDAKGDRVGVIKLDTGRIAGDDDDCSKKLSIRYATPTAGMMLNDRDPTGTVQGRLPD